MPKECKNRYSRETDRSGRARDYAYARTRARLSRTTVPGEHVYDLARHLAERRRSEDQAIEKEFREHAERWKNETGHLSSLTKATAHPSYLRIIGLAKDSRGHGIEKLLLNELEAEPDHWFPALSAITGQDPVNAEHDFDAAVAAWLDWGKEKGII
jgi:GNAT superfamily N-acetyltransferase